MVPVVTKKEAEILLKLSKEDLIKLCPEIGKNRPMLEAFVAGAEVEYYETEMGTWEDATCLVLSHPERHRFVFTGKTKEE